MCQIDVLFPVTTVPEEVTCDVAQLQRQSFGAKSRLESGDEHSSSRHVMRGNSVFFVGNQYLKHCEVQKSDMVQERSAEKRDVQRVSRCFRRQDSR